MKVHKIANHVLTIEERNRIVSFKNNFPNLRVAVTDTYCIEAISKNASKGIGLTWLLNHLNINSDEVMAIGDSESDIPMFEVVGISYAVDNTFEEVKEKASMVIKSNDDDGVAEILERLIKNNMTNVI